MSQTHQQDHTKQETEHIEHMANSRKQDLQAEVAGEGFIQNDTEVVQEILENEKDERNNAVVDQEQIDYAHAQEEVMETRREERREARHEKHEEAREAKAERAAERKLEHNRRHKEEQGE